MPLERGQPDSNPGPLQGVHDLFAILGDNAGPTLLARNSPEELQGWAGNTVEYRVIRPKGWAVALWSSDMAVNMGSIRWGVSFPGPLIPRFNLHSFVWHCGGESCCLLVSELLLLPVSGPGDFADEILPLFPRCSPARGGRLLRNPDPA